MKLHSSGCVRKVDDIMSDQNTMSDHNAVSSGGSVPDHEALDHEALDSEAPNGGAPHGDVTLQEAADLLSVHYMTAYRYVRLGLLPARKEGSTWRVDRGDLEEFRGEAAVEPAPRSRKRAPWSERLEARLLAGDSRGSWGVIESALASGSDLDSVYLDVLSPALASIGERWRAGEIDVAAEHRASGIALRIVGRLGPRFTRRGRTRGAVVLGTAVGERHSLPLALLGDLARAAGFEVSDLGADLPPESFVRIVAETQRLVAVGISSMTPQNDRAVATTIAAIAAACPDVPVVLGGLSVVDADHARALGATDYAADGREFVALLDQYADRRSLLVQDSDDLVG
jgi:excisionase family DNA binding protein